MNWKKDVTVIEEQENITLCLGKNKCYVTKIDFYLVKAIKKGIYEEEQIKELIMKHDNCNEIVAGLTLAKFILDYEGYLDKDKGYYEITM